jgi:Zn-dependent alcohol dehydrogenase
MKTRIFSLLIAGALMVAQSGMALAQGRGWSAVQAVPADDRLIVKQKDGKTIEGKMIEASETNLTLSRDKKVVNISRDNIAQIEHSQGKAAKTKWALIGAGIGAGTGAAIGQSKVKSDAEIWLPVGLIFGTGIGAGVGALIGASRRQREVIYSAP